jgi:multiple sugar transport system ATP-binding protein
MSILHLRVDGVPELLAAKLPAGQAQQAGRLDSGAAVTLAPDAAWALPFGADERLAA